MGGLVFTAFIIQAATGVAMTFYYVPDVSRALLSDDSWRTALANGWITRSMHRWTASLMVMFLVLHVFRVYLTGGFKKPRP
jgi:cytochrome b6